MDFIHERLKAKSNISDPYDSYGMTHIRYLQKFYRNESIRLEAENKILKSENEEMGSEMEIVKLNSLKIKKVIKIISNEMSGAITVIQSGLDQT